MNWLDAKKTIINLFGGLLVLLVLCGLIAGASEDLFGFLALPLVGVYYIFVWVNCWKMMMAMHWDSSNAIMFLIFTIVGGLGLLILISKATGILKQASIRVGLLGVSAEDLEQLKAVPPAGYKPSEPTPW